MEIISLKNSIGIASALPKEAIYAFNSIKDQISALLKNNAFEFKLKKKTVFVLHGMGQQPGFANSFLKKANKRYGGRKKGFVPVYYPSFFQSIDESALQVKYLIQSVQQMGDVEQFYFSGHSLGGLIVRHIAEELELYNSISGASLHATPNHGTEVASRFSLIAGPAVRQMIPNSDYILKLNAKYVNLIKRTSFNQYLNIRAVYDPLIIPSENAHLEGAVNEVYSDLMHLGALFDDKVLKRVVEYFGL